MFQAIPIWGAAYDIWYGCAFFMGLIVLLLFSLEKFDKPYPGNKHLAELFPKNISAGSAYTKAFLIYFAILFTMYTLACIILPTVPNISNVVFGFDVLETLKSLFPSIGVASSGARSTATPAIPLAVALLMVGLFPKAKSFGEIEAPLRRFSHRLIGVPGGLAELERVVAQLALNVDTLNVQERAVRRNIMRLFLSRQLSRAPSGAKMRLQQWLESGDLDAPLPDATGGGLPEADVKFLTELEEQVSTARSVADKWHRAKFLMSRLDNPSARILDPDVATRFTQLRGDMSANYNEVKRAIERITLDVTSIVELLQTLSKARLDPGAPVPGTNLPAADLTRLENFLDSLLKKRQEDLSLLEPSIDDVLGKVHLLAAAAILLKPVERDRNSILSALGLVNVKIPKTYTDDILLTIAILSASLFLFNYQYQIFNGNTSAVSVAARVVFSTLIVHGVSAFIAYGSRRRRISNGTWKFPFEGGVNVPVRQYAGLGVVTFIPAYLGILLWTAFLFASQDASGWPLVTGIYASLSISALGGVVTAIFIVCNLDLAERRAISNLTILGRSLAQGLLTAFVVFLSMQVQFVGVQTGPVLDVVGTGFITGTVIGATVLKIAARTREQGLNPPMRPTPAAAAGPASAARA